MKHRARTRPLARLGLLLAALLYTGGAGAGPWVHALALRATDVTVGEQGGERRRSDAPAPHDEQHCAVCHALHGAALPAGSAVFVAAPAPPPPPASAAEERAGAPRFSSARPRAPPLA